MTPSRQTILTNDVDALAHFSSPVAASTRFLILKTQAVGLKTMAMLATLKLEQLEYLSLSDVALGDAGMLQLAFNVHFLKLRAFSISHCSVTDVGLAALASASWATGLKDLVLANQSGVDEKHLNQIGNKGALSLANSEKLQRLETLDIGFTSVGDEGAIALLNSVHLDKLRELIVWRTQLTQNGANQCSAASGLREKRGASYCVVHSDFTPRQIEY